MEYAVVWLRRDLRLDDQPALRAALEHLSPSEAAAETARELGLPRRDLYRRALDLKGKG